MSLSLIAEAYLIEVEDDGEPFEEEFEEKFDLRSLDKVEDNQESVQELVDKEKVSDSEVENDEEKEESGNKTENLKTKSSFRFENNVRVNLKKTWPFTHCRLIISRSDDQEAQEFDPYAKDNWVLQGTKHVFRDFITSEEIEEIGEEVEKLGELLPEPPGLEFFQLPIQPELGKVYSSATQGHKEEEEKNVNCHKYHLRQKRKLNAKIVEESSHKEIKKSRKDISPGSNCNEIKKVIPPGSKLDIPAKKGDIPPKSSSHKPFKCPFCFKVYLGAGDLIVHLKTHTQSKTKTASVSSDQSNHDSGIVADVSSDSANASEDESAKRSKETAGRWFCVICGGNFRRSYDLDNHMDEHFGENRFKCPLCSRGFSQLSSLEAHISAVHGDGISLLQLLESSKSNKINFEATTKCSSKDGGLGLRPCKVVLKRCDYMLRTSPIKESTISVRNSSDKSKTERSLYSRHYTTSADARKRKRSGYQSVICRSESKNEISADAVAHKTSKKIFSCPKCPNMFSSVVSMQFHLKSHGDAYRCPHCGKGFSAQFHLSRHLPVHQKVVHTVAKPYQCPRCPKKFSRNSYLRLHLKRHDGIRPFGCPICMKTFTERSVLNRHQWVHSDATHQCSECPSRFKDPFYLKRHQNTHHPPNTNIPTRMEESIPPSE